MDLFGEVIGGTTGADTESQQLTLEEAQQAIEQAIVANMAEQKPEAHEIPHVPGHPPPGVRVHRGVLTDELIFKIKKDAMIRSEHRLNLTSWEPSIVHSSGPILLYDIREPLMYQLQAQIAPYFDLPPGKYKWHAVYHVGSRLSYIPWHDDEFYLRSCTIYVNEKWDLDWGGALLYDAGDQDYRAEFPEYNKAVVLFLPVKHGTVMPTLEAPLRESIQIFVGAAT